VPDKEIYGRAYGSKRYLCVSCGANVGIHDEGEHKGDPIDLLADEDLSSQRKRLHEYFDPLWTETHLERQPAYDWIFGEIMGLIPERRHIAMLTEEECRTLIIELKMNHARYLEEAKRRGANQP